MVFAGIFRGLTRLGRRPAFDESVNEGLGVLLHGRDAFTLEVAGCGRHQVEIREMMALRGDAARRRKCVALLDLDRTGGAPRVAVVIDGTHIGYFPRYLSTQYCEWLDTWKLGKARVHCQALVHGDTGKCAVDVPEYRVKLDIEIPFKMTSIPD